MSIIYIQSIMNKFIFEIDNKEKCREIHKNALEKCLKDKSIFYRSPDDPILLFIFINNKIQETGNPWLFNDEGHNPSFFTNKIFYRHFECLDAWKKWRENVPQPN